jgi:glutamine amidotransferase
MIVNKVGILKMPSSNLSSIVNSIEFLKYHWVIIDSSEDLLSVKKLIIPGVGSFFKSMEYLDSRGLIESIISFIKNGGHVLGICLGMQILLSEGVEDGLKSGLNIIKGTTIEFDSDQQGIKVPHVGWNNIKVLKQIPILEGINDFTDFYFTHSFYSSPFQETNIVATTEYGITFPSIISNGNVFGVQFHPEKSGKMGLKLIQNFIQYA